ncbi:MAG: SpoIIE family protein phosphatase [Candidatus Ozemobacteraceae bacterium]
MNVNNFLRRHPHGVMVGAIIVFIWTISAHFDEIDPEHNPLAKLLSLTLVIIAALIMGVLSYWWFYRPPQQIYESDNVAIDNQSIDVNEMFFQPHGMANWLEQDLSRLKGLYTNLERISQLLGFINYSLELTRQLKVALSLAHEIFPKHTFLIFLNQADRLKFQLGTNQAASGQLIQMDEKSPLVQRTIEVLKNLIDFDKLHEVQWKGFALPIKGKNIPPDFTLLPLMLWNRILGITVLINSEMKLLSKDEKILATLLGRHMAIFIENHVLYREKVSQERLLHEVEIARQVQIESLPSTITPLKGFDIYAQCIPCNEISGDYYDLVPLPRNRLLITIADVSGKGLPAALFLSKLQTLVRALAENHDSPAKFLSYLSRHMSSENMGSLFATMLIVIIEANGTSAICSSAGHCKPLVVRTGSGFIEEVNFEIGIPLGLFDMGEGGYIDQTIDLIPGDGIFLYTDGITDLVGRCRERYGIERLRSAMENYPASGKANSFVFQILEDMNRFKGPTPLEDDLTMVYIKAEKHST